jgi:hypothetical protein
VAAKAENNGENENIEEIMLTKINNGVTESKYRNGNERHQRRKWRHQKQTAKKP